METIVKIAIRAAVGWIIEQIAADVLREMGVRAHSAKVADAVVGALV